MRGEEKRIEGEGMGGKRRGWEGIGNEGYIGEGRRR